MNDYKAVKKFKKVYVGKGHMSKEGMDITRITLKMEELQKLIYEFERTQMVTIEVARKKEPDTFGRTHTVYARMEVPQTEEKPKKKTSRKKK